jgi:putative tryptophan/tyrosine transport system substrate-binding protein
MTTQPLSALRMLLSRHTRRREFITLLGGAAAAWPVAARAQQGDRMRRVGVLMAFSESKPEFRSLIDTFVQGLARLGWVDGRNVQIDVRWAGGDVGQMRTFAKQLVEAQPDVILAGTTPATAALQRQTRTIPIVFVIVADPVGAGFVAGLPRPSGNMTGFINAEPVMGGKWLEMLKEIAPRAQRTAIMFNPDTAPGGGTYFLAPFEAAARSLAEELIVVRVRSDAEIEAGLASLGREQAGLIIMPDAFMAVHQATVISAATRNSVPTIGADLPNFAKEGGLLSYGASFPDIFRRAAPYVDRILRGANPADLPVQAPTKYELVINLKAVKALGLDVPPTLLARADEVIE